MFWASAVGRSSCIVAFDDSFCESVHYSLFTDVSVAVCRASPQGSVWGCGGACRVYVNFIVEVRWAHSPGFRDAASLSRRNYVQARKAMPCARHSPRRRFILDGLAAQHAVSCAAVRQLSVLHGFSSDARRRPQMMRMGARCDLRTRPTVLLHSE